MLAAGATPAGPTFRSAPVRVVGQVTFAGWRRWGTAPRSVRFRFGLSPGTSVGDRHGATPGGPHVPVGSGSGCGPGDLRRVAGVGTAPRSVRFRFDLSPGTSVGDRHGATPCGPHVPVGSGSGCGPGEPPPVAGVGTAPRSVRFRFGLWAR